MSYTFGSAATDYIATGNFANLFFSNQYVDLFCGWVYPTTLTAGRYWIGGTGAHGIYIDSTTSEMRLKTINATTAGEWLTSGLGLVVNKWQFLAFICTFNNTGPAGTVKAYIGDIDNPPVEVSVSNPVAPVGNFTLSSGFTIGNQNSAASLSWQGDIGVTYVVAINPTAAAGGRIWSTTHGALTAQEQQNIFYAYLQPFYQGKLFSDLNADYQLSGQQGQPVGVVANLDTVNPVLRRLHGNNLAITTPITMTFSGCTPSQLRSPSTPFYYDSKQLPRAFRK